MLQKLALQDLPITLQNIPRAFSPENPWSGVMDLLENRVRDCESELRSYTQ